MYLAKERGEYSDSWRPERGMRDFPYALQHISPGGYAESGRGKEGRSGKGGEIGGSDHKMATP